MAAHWSELPRDLLELIVEKLDLVDHARFASVCSSWRSVAVENPPINKPLYFVLSHEPMNLLRRFITSFVPSWKKARFIGAAMDGWLVILIDGRKLFLLNRGLNSTIPLPLLSKHRYNLFQRQDVFKAVLSSAPSSSLPSECTVVIKHDMAGVYYYRIGSDDSFTMLSNIRDAEDIIFYKGRLYVLCFPKILVVFDRLLNMVSKSELGTNLPKDLIPWHFFISENHSPSIIAGRRPGRYSVFPLEGSDPRLNNIGEDDNFHILLSNPYCSLSITAKQHKEFRRDTNYFKNDISTFVLDMSKDPNKAKADDPWPLFFVMFSYLGIKNMKCFSRTLLELPRDMLELILEKLDLADRARFASVCSSLRSIAKDLVEVLEENS